MHVLIVDDAPEALSLLAEHVSRGGYEVVTATNGIDAMRIAQTEGPPLIITDWMMPGMDGLELCRAIRAHDEIPFAYIIILTSYSEEEKIVEALDAGADDFLVKPFKRRELLARLRVGQRIASLKLDLERRNREVHLINARTEIANVRLAEANEKLNHLATFDELTGLFNRRVAMSHLRECWALSLRHNDPLACIALDIDHFKRCNDQYGHAVGDAVLKEVAAALRCGARQEERVCRVGGEEFLIVCPRSTEAMAVVAAERLRRAVESRTVVAGDLRIRVTMSLGVAERTPEMTEPDELLKAADAALYAAKKSGRNVVCRASADAAEAPAAKPGETLAPGVSLHDTIDDERKDVLILDLDPQRRQACAQALLEEGYHVRQSGDLPEALHQFEIRLPDILILDAGVPECDGVPCVLRLKQVSGGMGLVVILAASPEEWSGLGEHVRSAIDEMVRKPLDRSELIRRVRTMIRFRSELIRSNSVRGEQSRALALLGDFSRQICIAESLESVLEATAGAVTELTCNRRLALLFPDSGGGFLQPVKTLGMKPELVARLRIPIGAGICGEVYQTRQTILANSLQDRTPKPTDPDYDLFTAPPWVVTPLTSAESIVGVLVIMGREAARPFTDLDLEYINLIDNMAASAIHDYLTSRARDDARHSIVVALAKLAESRDADTGRHLDRVTRYCLLLARQLRTNDRYRDVITEEFLRDLERAIPLHDIGKVAIPDGILRKPGRLSPDERAIMRTHAEIGGQTIRSVIDRAPGADFLLMAEQIARGHHEWFDGGGYPNCILGHEIPLPARIASIADVYDALTTDRAYKSAMSHRRAVSIIVASSGSQFDPDLVEAFQRCEAEFERLALELRDDATMVRAAVRSPDDESESVMSEPGGVSR